MPSQNAEASLAALSTAVGTAARAVRGLQPRPGRRLRPARRHAGLRAPGRRDREAVPGRAGQDDLEPRGGPGARLLPADLAVQDGGRPRRRAAISSGCTSACRASRSTPLLAPHNIKDGKDRGSCRACGTSAGRRAVRLHRAEPAHRVRDAQHARAGRPVAGRQHQPERRSTSNASWTRCARAAGKDSLEFRRALMQKHPKHLAVLNAAAEKGDWGKPLPAGVHRGIAQFMGYGSYSAAVAEVSVSGKGEVKVHRMVLALNCGHAVNPATIAAQVEGSVAYGFDSLLRRDARSTRAASWSTNFHTYRIARLARDAQGRDGDRADLRFLGRRGRADDLRGGAGGAERDPRGDRQAGAHAAAQESRVSRSFNCTPPLDGVRRAAIVVPCAECWHEVPAIGGEARRSCLAGCAAAWR